MKALIKALVGMFIGISIIAFILIMLFIVERLVTHSRQEMAILEMIGLLIISAAIGAIIGFFDDLDLSSKMSAPANQEEQSSHKNNKAI